MSFAAIIAIHYFNIAQPYSEEVEVEDDQEDNQFEHPSNQSAEQHYSEFTLPHQVKLYYGDH